MVTFTSALAAIIDTISFFFQAEDGIRDTSVTGVQTCALPISQLATLADAKVASCAGAFILLLQHLHPLVIAQKRSEERRVGKECRAREGRQNVKKRDR